MSCDGPSRCDPATFRPCPRDPIFREVAGGPLGRPEVTMPLGGTMGDMLGILSILVGWVVLQVWILPRFGVHT